MHIPTRSNELCQLLCRKCLKQPVWLMPQLTTLCVSPDGNMLLAIDEDGKGLLINRKRRVLLHHVSFATHVEAAAFSPNGAFLACAVGRILQVAAAASAASIFHLMAWTHMRMRRRCGELQRTPKLWLLCSYIGPLADAQTKSLRLIGAQILHGWQLERKTSPAGACCTSYP